MNVSLVPKDINLFYIKFTLVFLQGKNEMELIFFIVCTKLFLLISAGGSNGRIQTRNFGSRDDCSYSMLQTLHPRYHLTNALAYGGKEKDFISLTASAEKTICHWDHFR